MGLQGTFVGIQEGYLSRRRGYAQVSVSMIEIANVALAACLPCVNASVRMLSQVSQPASYLEHRSVVLRHMVGNGSGE